VVQQYSPANSGGAIQTGLATWYGPGFDGNITYCGQVYDSRQYTAASNTLPCGSVVTVSNQVTGASVTVTITDRGAFTHAIDLSHAAFSAIASPSAGVAPIVVTAGK
jgi:rare lipoprotein A